jgi:hypothetical protein
VQVPTSKVVFEKLILPAPAVAETLPPQLLTTLGVDATTRLPGMAPTFDGRLSVKLAFIGTTLGFEIENVMVLVVPVPEVVWIVFGLKLVIMEGGARITMPAVAVPPLEAAKPVLAEV